MSLGTRTRQMALYVVFDSYLGMMSDSPTNYIKEQECTDFIASTPTVWEETRFLKGRCGEYVVVARRSKDRWFIAGLTDWTARDI